MTENATVPIAPAKKRGVFAWALWDWGSSGFNAVVTAFVFTVYITDEAFGSETEVTQKLGISLLVTGVLVALLAPAVGGLADSVGRRKTWLGITSGIVILSTALLACIAPDPSFLLLGLVLLSVGTVAYEFAAVSYNAMLSQVSTTWNVGRISGFGWGLGYLGSIALLVILLVGFIIPDVGWFGITDEGGWSIRISMLVTAAWFAVFAIPIFTAVPELDTVPSTPNQGTGLVGAYRELFGSIARLWRERREILYFLIASAVFRDGVAGATAVGGVIAARSFGFDDADVMIFGIVAVALAGITTLVVSQFEDRLGSKRVIVWSLAIMVACSIILFAVDLPGVGSFWVFGLVLCIFMGPVQSASRSFLARLIPSGMEGEIFGLYATTGRAASFLTPAAFTLAVSIGGSAIAAALGLTAVLLLGLLLMLGVREPRFRPQM